MLGMLLEKIARHSIDTELILLRRKRIKHCKGCLRCELGGVNRKGECKIGDDMKELYPVLREADALVLGTPVYFDMLSGMLKNFMDRTNPIWPYLKGKPIAGIAVAEEGIGKAVENLQTYASICGMHWAGSVTALAKERKQVEEDSTIVPLLEKLADDLVSMLR